MALLALRAATLLPFVPDMLTSDGLVGRACALVIALALALGGFTRAAALLSAVWVMVLVLATRSVDVGLACHLLAAAALAVLGPGFLSLDAALFGRRVVRVLPPSKE